MKPFPALTENGKIGRLRQLAVTALGAYDVDGRRLTCVARRTSTTFRVDAEDRRRFALRVGPAPSAVALHTPTEIAWLQKLADDPAIAAVRPLPNRSGELITPAGHPGVPEERSCVLFEWIPGTPLDESAGRVDFGMLGEVAAHLHEQARRWRRRRGLRPLIWDKVFYYPNEPASLYDGRFRRIITPERAEVFRALEARATAELERLHRDVPTHLLHGGLHPGNVILHAGTMQVLGFEEVMLGVPVQDVAITLFHARRFNDYEALLSAFIAGYRSVREWPVEYEGQVLLLMAARRLMLVNYLLRNGIESEEFVAAAVEETAGLL